MHVNVCFSVGLRKEELYPNTSWKKSQNCNIIRITFYFLNLLMHIFYFANLLF